MDNTNKFPSSLPGKEGTQFGPSWFEMMPWLNSFSLAKFAGKPKYIKATDIESVGYFIQTCMCPPPPLDDVRLKKRINQSKGVIYEGGFVHKGHGKRDAKSDSLFCQRPKERDLTVIHRHISR